MGHDPTNKARVQRAKQVVEDMGLDCTLFEIVLRRSPKGGYGFRLGSSRTIGHVVAQVANNGLSSGLLSTGDLVLAVNDRLLLRYVL